MVYYRRDELRLRKDRGAFFTPPAIASYLSRWALKGLDRPAVLDPTCGDGAFLLAAAEIAKEDSQRLSAFGVDLDAESLADARRAFESRKLDVQLYESDFFEVASPTQGNSDLPLMDVVIGNPPFVRFQKHSGKSRTASAAAALRAGVRLNGLASSWAAALVHASSFLNLDGRLAMVLPAELLTVDYAEPIRAWLRTRFNSVQLIMFERLQFDDALADVVLLLAEGSGGCDAFSLYHVRNAADLEAIGAHSQQVVLPPVSGKWTDLLVPPSAMRVFESATREHFTPLQSYGRLSLGAVTGFNGFFALNEETRQKWSIDLQFLAKISPPGTKHLRGSRFHRSDWEAAKESGLPVYLFRPVGEVLPPNLQGYIEEGMRLGAAGTYKSRIRDPWYLPPSAPVPDFFFTYMSHLYPRLIENSAGVGILNSMHGLTLSKDAKSFAGSSLGILALNSATMLDAELRGRSYGGGLLKMEPSEARHLLVPSPEVIRKCAPKIKEDRAKIERLLRSGSWVEVQKMVDALIFDEILEWSTREKELLFSAAGELRTRRLDRGK